MDIITQGIVGAAVAQSVAKKEHARLATMIGFFSGLLADVDVLIRSSTDPLLVLEYHRHFTHSVFFIPIGALIAFILLWPFLRNRLPAGYLYFYCVMGYLLSGFIDACTSYGTHLLWPLIGERIAWHIIAIVDPIFTLALLIGLVAGFIAINKRYSQIGITFAGAYLLFGVVQLQRAEATVYELAAQRGHEIEQLMVKPTLGNTLLWRSVYRSDDVFYIDAVRASFTTRVYRGATVEKFQADATSLGLPANSTQANDIQRFRFFSDDFVAIHPQKPNVIGDVRYSMSPLSNVPLWGVEVDPLESEKHVSYVFFRRSNEYERKQFIDMLLGNDV